MAYSEFYVHQKEVQDESLHVTYNYSTHLLKKAILSSINCLGIHAKSKLSVGLWLYSEFCSISLIYIFILLEVPHCLEFCRFLVIFIITNCKSSNYNLLSAVCLATWYLKIFISILDSHQFLFKKHLTL